LDRRSYGYALGGVQAMKTKLRVSLVEGGVARLYGPLEARVVDGQVVVLGAIYNRGDSFTVYRYRSYAVKALTDSVIDVVLEEGGSIEQPGPGEEPLDKWVYSIDSLLRRGCRSFMVLGQVDSGKSSLAALIANRGLLYGYQVGVIDADVGQADIGPPGCVSAAFVRNPILWLRELSPDRIRFIGYITPQRAERRIMSAIVDLAYWLRGNGADVVVVDTDGWIQGVQSLEYKLEAAYLAGIDAVVVIGDEKLYRMVSSSWSRRGCGVVLLDSPSVRRIRDRADRRSLRVEAYKRFLEPRRMREVDLDKISVFGSCFFMGERLPDETARGFSSILRVHVLAASETYDTIYVVTIGQPDPVGVEKLSNALNKQVYILDLNNAKGALLGVIGPEGYEVAIGILEDIDFVGGRVKLATSYEGPITGLIIGGTRLGPNLEEQGRPLRCVV
jgi:polynucleotide 5'-hydroxyl-kinase GRC3/NOL9